MPPPLRRMREGFSSTLSNVCRFPYNGRFADIARAIVSAANQELTRSLISLPQALLTVASEPKTRAASTSAVLRW